MKPTPTALPDGAADHAERLDHDNADRLRTRLQALGGAGRVTVCGGGLVGVELSSEIAEAFPNIGVTLITSGQVAPLNPAGARAVLRGQLQAVGVRVLEELPVEFVGKDYVQAAEPIPHDLCVAVTGMRAPGVLANSDLPLNARGQVVVDTFMRALHTPEVYVAGDAASPALDPGSPVAMGCKYGMPMAAQAAANAMAELASRRLAPLDFDDTHFLISVGRQ